MRKLFTILAVIIVIRLLPKALRREAQFLELMTALCQCLLVTLTATNAKVSALDKRSSDTAAALLTVRNTLNGHNTGNAGLPDGTLNGASGDAGLANGTIGGTSGGASAGTSHTHGAGSYSVNNGHHTHGSGTYSVTNGNHNHTLPTV